MRPRIRSFKPELWADEKVCALSRDARLLMLGLISIADDEGRFRARRSQLVGDIFPDDDDAAGLLSGWVAEIQQQGIVLFYVSDGVPYGAFRNWRRHQKINKPTPSLLPPPPSPKVVRDNAVRTTAEGTDNSGSSTGAVPEESVLARRRAFRSDPDQVRAVLNNGSQVTEPQRAILLAGLLAAWISHNDPKASPDPDSTAWRRDMRLLLADRKGDVDEVVRIIDWCQADGFWRSNILSPAKLRKQFTQLALRASAPANVRPIKENASSMLRDLWAEPSASPIVDAEVVEGDVA